MKSIFTIAGILLMTVGGVYGEGSQELDGVKVLQSDERGLEIEVMRSGKRGFFVGIPPEGSIGIQPLDSYGEEIRIAYTGFIRDQRVAKIEILPKQAGSRQKIRFRLTLKGEGAIPHSALRTPPPEDPFERILSRILINYPQARQWRKKTAQEGSKKDAGILGGSLPRYRIIVNSDGIYRIPYEDLVKAGMNVAGVDPRTFRLENKGREVPIYLVGEEDGTFDEEDYFEFYGEFNRGKETYFDLYSFENVYWLSWGGGLGVRLVEEDGGLTETDPSQYLEPTSFEHLIHFETDQLYMELTRPTIDTSDMWFWQLLRASGQGVTPFAFLFPSPDPFSQTPVSFKMFLHGVTYDSDPFSLDHHLLAYLNGFLIGDTRWNGQSPHLFFGSGPRNNTLLDGENLITLVLPDSAVGDNQLLNWMEFTYQRLYKAREDSVTFSTPKDSGMGLYQFRIQGFTSPEIEIYKKGISKIVNFLVEPVASGFDTTYDAVFQDDVFSEGVKYVALTPSRKKKPLRIVGDTPSDLRSTTNGADLVVITHEKFVGALQDYVNWREGQGVGVSLVTTQDIYDEFNSGIFSPKAIKKFLIYAYENWNPKPYYVLLVGDGTWDYRNITGQGGNLVPSLLQWHGDFGWVSVDNAFAAVSGEDYLPDLFVGRLPVREVGELDAVLAKIMGYETNPTLGDWRRNFIFATGSGNRKGIAFRTIFEDSVIARFLPPWTFPTRIYADPGDPFFGDRDSLIDAINDGASIVGYFGHGGGSVWSHPYLLRNDDLYLLTNRDRLPFVASFTCFTAIFDDPNPSYESLGEGLLKLPERGAIAVWGSAGGSFFDNGLWITQSFMRVLFEADSAIRFGDLVVGTKLNYAGSVVQTQEKTVVEVYTLLGDPLVLLGLPSPQPVPHDGPHLLGQGGPGLVDTLPRTDGTDELLVEGQSLLLQGFLPLSCGYPWKNGQDAQRKKQDNPNEEDPPP
ncbi:hypothetical protein IIA15_06425 [candidate division TA06 bacterium]|nr:hypothetical protein [candidate division TA06 bacterium]